jgi:hypothetical protein
MKKCYKCGASIADAATFCPQCFTKFDNPGSEPSVTQPTQAPRIAPGYAEHDIDRPGKYPEIPHYKLSRFRSSQTSLGLIGRLFFTLVFLVAPVYLGIRYLGIWNLAFLPAFLFGLAPILVKAIWKKVRVPVR